ncbi:MAG: hypothetical protein JJU29_08365 [Verrucomicrobia bacterium]|nr:hypothetical protein [Verrucomicrobiota bacterium]MCH8512135.1 hypothetical protein [Kiritimatiellia bacterium]
MAVSRSDFQNAGWWFITNRSNPGLHLFRDAEDFSHMVSCLSEGTGLHAVRISGYVLLPDHFHVVLHVEKGVLPRFMHWMNLCYGHRHRARHNFRGHLFAGNYDAKALAEDDDTLLRASHYLHLHPHRTAQGFHGPALPWLPSGTASNPEMAISGMIAHGWSSVADWLNPAHCRDWIQPQPQRTDYRSLLLQVLREGIHEGIGSLPGPLSTCPTAVSLVLPEDVLHRLILEAEAEQGLSWDDFRDLHGHPGRDLVICRAAREGLNTETLGQLLQMTPAAVSKVLQRSRRLPPH